MNDLFTSDSDTNGSEPLDEGGTWLLDLVSAVDHLRRGYRPGFTVWDALAEATEWLNDEPDDSEMSSDVIESTRQGPIGSAAFQRSIRRWVLVMAERYNSGYSWPHPSSRRGFPPRLVDS